MAQPPTAVYALLADGTTVEIRPAVPADFDAVKAMHEAMSRDNTYLRFFNISRHSAEIEARRICRNPKPGSAALLAVANGEVVGVASYVPPGDDPHAAEVAFAVADHMHHRGIATLLLEHLVSLARSRRISTFRAETLSDNQAMLGVFADAGLPVRRRYAEGVIELAFPLPDQDGRDRDSYLDAVAERERSADVASLRHIFAPGSVAVIGASRRRGTVGRAVLDNIRAAGYRGRLYVVNPRAAQVGDQPTLASPLDLPEPADLAVIAVPAARVLEVAAQCGERGVRSLVVITSGLDPTQSAELLAITRSHGMRLVGPDCFGVAVPGLGLDATFAARPARPGVTGLVMQSGGLGFALVDHLSRLGIGISSFASVGDKLDVSGNDMLLWWERDDQTRLAVLYLESFGNPRKFARTARRVSCAMPVLTVLTSTGLAEATPFRETLFEQAGVVTTGGFDELVEAAALLATQPVPAGRTVAILSNVRTAGQLAAQAGASAGLRVRGPAETPAPVQAGAFRERMEQLAADDEVHAVVAIVLPTGATGDLEAAIREATVAKPLAAVVLTQPESVRLIDNRIPAYGSPEAAVRAVARAAGYGAWRAAPRGEVPDLPGVRTADARALVQAPGWLGPARAAELLACYGIPLADPSGGFGGVVPPGVSGDPSGTPRVVVRVAGDQVFGPLVRLEAGDSSRTARFTPLTDVDAAYLTRSRPDLDVLRDLLLRVSRLADDLPEVAELELDLGGAAVISARVKVEPSEPQDPYLRRLR
jgi:acyl-CoA synthetase (NDP forming)/GNAT superfamily N-acetyltransferase